MISHFTKLGYTPIVGDSFTSDTPLFIRYKNSGLIDIMPISELISHTEKDALGREYDKSEKDFYVLCRSGWVEPQYIYRHKTDKPIYRVDDGKSIVDVTEDHSLYDGNGLKVKPSEVTSTTKLEYYSNEISSSCPIEIGLDEKRIKMIARLLNTKAIDRIPMEVLNCTDSESIGKFLEEVKDCNWNDYSKTCRAGIMFLKDRIDNGKE